MRIELDETTYGHRRLAILTREQDYDYQERIAICENEPDVGKRKAVMIAERERQARMKGKK